jgi:peroxiredoxin
MMGSVMPRLLLLLPLLFLSAQAEPFFRHSGGNFVLSGNVRLPRKQSVSLRFRATGPTGYRIQFPTSVLDDPGRRPDPLAEPAAPPARSFRFRLTANAASIRFEVNGVKAWEFTETNLAVPSTGDLYFDLPAGLPSSALRDLAIEPLPPSPPSFAERYGPSLGAAAPSFTAVDQSGKPRSLPNLTGPKGLWLFFLRSADWCIFCKTQLVEIDRHAARLRQLGYEVAALTYDDPRATAHFAARRQLSIPLLADPASTAIDAFHLRNEAATTGFAKGVTRPALLILDASGRVEAKYLEEDYKERLTVANLLANRLGLRAAPAADPIDRPRIRLNAALSSPIARPGQPLTLSLDAIFARGLHAYAPGAPQEFIPISWTLESSPHFTAADPVWPTPERTRLYGVDEPVPNYTGLLRLSRNITLAPRAALLKSLPDGELTINGTFRYQACNDRLCFPPENIPVTWRILIEGLDRGRVPPEFQKPDRP